MSSDTATLIKECKEQLAGVKRHIDAVSSSSSGEGSQDYKRPRMEVSEPVPQEPAPVPSAPVPSEPRVPVLPVPAAPVPPAPVPPAPQQQEPKAPLIAVPTIQDYIKLSNTVSSLMSEKATYTHVNIQLKQELNHAYTTQLAINEHINNVYVAMNTLITFINNNVRKN